MAPTISQISKELNIPTEDLTKRSLMAFLEHELRLAEEDIADITIILGKRSIGSAKLRIFFKDQRYLDVWLSQSGKYGFAVTGNNVPSAE